MDLDLVYLVIEAGHFSLDLSLALLLYTYHPILVSLAPAVNVIFRVDLEVAQ